MITRLVLMLAILVSVAFRCDAGGEFSVFSFQFSDAESEISKIGFQISSLATRLSLVTHCSEAPPPVVSAQRAIRSYSLGHRPRGSTSLFAVRPNGPALLRSNGELRMVGPLGLGEFLFTITRAVGPGRQNCWPVGPERAVWADRSGLAVASAQWSRPAGGTYGPAFRFPLSALAAAQSLTNRNINWPDWAQWRRVLLLRDYNTQVVMLGTSLLGLAAGLVGSFTLLRRRALMGDALSHATLPGVGLAFLFAPALGLEGKSLPVLLVGAAISGIAGVASILYVRNMTRLKEDAALGIVLSVYFGAGIAILTVIQQLPDGHAAGLESFIYGKTASMIASDAMLIATSGLIAVVIIVAASTVGARLCATFNTVSQALTGTASGVTCTAART